METTTGLIQKGRLSASSLFIGLGEHRGGKRFRLLAVLIALKRLSSFLLHLRTGLLIRTTLRANAEAARLLAIAEAFGLFRVSAANVAILSEVFFVFLLIRHSFAVLGWENYLAHGKRY